MEKIFTSINHLSLEELMELHEQVVERIKLLRENQTRQEMLNFQPGQRVYFQTRDDEIIFGTLLKRNKKTVSLLTDDGERWNVAPELLTPDTPIPNPDS